MLPPRCLASLGMLTTAPAFTAAWNSPLCHVCHCVVETGGQVVPRWSSGSGVGSCSYLVIKQAKVRQLQHLPPRWQGPARCVQCVIVRCKYITRWSVGLMDKASASGAGDSRLESWADHYTSVPCCHWSEQRGAVVNLLDGLLAQWIRRWPPEPEIPG